MACLCKIIQSDLYLLRTCVRMREYNMYVGMREYMYVRACVRARPRRMYVRACGTPLSICCPDVYSRRVMYVNDQGNVLIGHEDEHSTLVDSSIHKALHEV